MVGKLKLNCVAKSSGFCSRLEILQQLQDFFKKEIFTQLNMKMDTTNSPIFHVLLILHSVYFTLPFSVQFFLLTTNNFSVELRGKARDFDIPKGMDT